MQSASQPPSQRPSVAQREVMGEFLVLSAQGGDREAFGRLVELWQEPLWRHARRLTGRDDAAWDVLQDSWLAVAKGLAQLRDTSLFKRWAYTIVTRAASTRLRRLPAEEIQAPEALEQTAQGTDEHDDREEAVRQLRRALHALKREDRVLVSLHYLEHFELWEAAKILDIPEGTAKSRLHRIRHQLRDTLEKHHE